MKQGRNNPAATGLHAVLADRVFDGRGWHHGAAVLIRDGRIVGAGPTAEVRPDAPQTRLPPGGYLPPGFIDLQVNGGGGILINDHATADGMRPVARAPLRQRPTAPPPTRVR